MLTADQSVIFRKYFSGAGSQVRKALPSIAHLNTQWDIDTTATLNGHRNADKRANSFWQFLHFFSMELLVFLLCRQTDKEFRLPWPSFVRVEIYYRYRLSINRNYRLPESWISHSEVVRASASRPRGHEFESRTIHFPYQGYFFYFLVFLSFSQFRSKTLWEFILKVRRYRICNGKEAKLFLFFQNC